MLADSLETDDIIKWGADRNLTEQGAEELPLLRKLRFWSKYKRCASLHEKI